MHFTQGSSILNEQNGRLNSNEGLNSNAANAQILTSVTTLERKPPIGPNNARKISTTNQELAKLPKHPS